MKRMLGGAALVAAVVALAPVQVDAQRGPQGQRGMMNRQAQPGVEHLMRMQEQLELSQDQIDDLDAIRQLVVQHQTSRQAEVAELRSQVMSGQLDRADMRDSAESRRNASEAFSDDIRTRIEAILTDAQKEELGDMMGRARAFQNGRASAQRGMRGNHHSMHHRGAARGQFRDQRMGPPGMQGPDQRRMMRRPGGDGVGFGPPWLDVEETPPPPVSGG